MSETSKQHKEHAPKKLAFAIYICSTSRYQQQQQMEKNQVPSDLGGDLVQKIIQESGHTVLYKKILADERNMIVNAFEDCLANADLDVAIFSGGTGIAPRDVTIEAVLPLLEKTLPGFGEFFRRLSFDEIGPAATLSRAIAGITGGKAFFCIPGSPNAIKTALEKLIIPEVPHIIKHARE